MSRRTRALLAVLAVLLLAYGLWATRYNVIACDYPRCLALDRWTGQPVMILPDEIRRDF